MTEDCLLFPVLSPLGGWTLIRKTIAANSNKQQRWLFLTVKKCRTEGPSHIEAEFERLKASISQCAGPPLALVSSVSTLLWAVTDTQRWVLVNMCVVVVQSLYLIMWSEDTIYGHISSGPETLKTDEPSKQSRLSSMKASVREDTRGRTGGESCQNKIPSAVL